MKVFDMLPGDLEPQKEIPIVKGRNRFYKMILSERGGIICPTKTPGEFIKKGDITAIKTLMDDMIRYSDIEITGNSFEEVLQKRQGKIMESWNMEEKNSLFSAF